MNITFHRANIIDIETIVEHRILFALELAGPQNEEAIQTLKKQISQYLLLAMTNDTCISYIAKCDDIVAGIGSMHLRVTPGNFKNPTGRWGYIMNMYTIPEFRRNGICKRILNLLVDEGNKIGITAFELHATKEGERVYTKEGFVHHSEPTLRKYILQ